MPDFDSMSPEELKEQYKALQEGMFISTVHARYYYANDILHSRTCITIRLVS
jgi:hypothetical protein